MGLLTALQASIATHLRATETLGTAPAIDVLEEDKGDIDSQIARSIGKLGLVVSIATPGLKPVENSRDYFEATILIEILETATVNRGPAGSQRTWLTVAECILANLLGWSPPGNWAAIQFGGMDQVAAGTPIVAQLTFITSAFVRPS